MQKITSNASPGELPPVAGFRVGDFVRLPNIGTPLEVIDLADPLLILRAPSGHELKAGWRAVTRIRTRAEINAGRNGDARV